MQFCVGTNEDSQSRVLTSVLFSLLGERVWQKPTCRTDRTDRRPVFSSPKFCHYLPLSTPQPRILPALPPGGGNSAPPSRHAPGSPLLRRNLGEAFPTRWSLGDSRGLSEVSRGWPRCRGNERPCLLRKGVARGAKLAACCRRWTRGV